MQQATYRSVPIGRNQADKCYSSDNLEQTVEMRKPCNPSYSPGTAGWHHKQLFFECPSICNLNVRPFDKKKGLTPAFGVTPETLWVTVLQTAQ